MAPQGEGIVAWQMDFPQIFWWKICRTKTWVLRPEMFFVDFSPSFRFVQTFRRNCVWFGSVIKIRDSFRDFIQIGDLETLNFGVFLSFETDPFLSMETCQTIFSKQILLNSKSSNVIIAKYFNLGLCKRGHCSTRNAIYLTNPIKIYCLWRLWSNLEPHCRMEMLHGMMLWAKKYW